MRQHERTVARGWVGRQFGRQFGWQFGWVIGALILGLSAAVSGAAPEEGGVALREAATQGDAARVVALLDAGVPIDAATEWGHTPLYLAASKGHWPLAQLLIERGANLHVRERFFGFTLINLALWGDRRDFLELFLTRGVEGAATVLSVAIARQDVELARIALQGELEPLELAAARREAAALPEILGLLASVEPVRRVRPPFVPEPARLAQLRGRYGPPGVEDPKAFGAAAVEISLEAGGLSLRWPGESTAWRLQPLAADHFEGEDGAFWVRFLSTAGLVEGLEVNRGGEVKVFARDPETSIADLQRATATVAPSAAPAGPAEGLATTTRVAQPWAQFRGPGASGIGDGQGAPLALDLTPGKGLRFKTPIPGIGLASPVVWGNRIFVATAISSQNNSLQIGGFDDAGSVDDRSEHQFLLLALDTRDGQIVWQREVYRGEPGALRHPKATFANATPVTDGQRVVVLFGAVGQLVAYDFAGNQLWRQDLGVMAANDPQAGLLEWGSAASPILAGSDPQRPDRVIVQADRRKDSFVAAYALADGRELWRTPRREPSSWATPTLVRAQTGDELVLNASTLRGYDPRTGAELWSLSPNSSTVVPTPVSADGLIFLTAGYPPIRPIYALRVGQRGVFDLEAANGQPAVAWSQKRGGSYIATPIVYRNFLHLCSHTGILATYAAGSGELQSTLRLANTGIAVTASPIAADGRLYVFSEEGKAFVLAAGAEPRLLGSYDLGEPVLATPALSDGLLVVRTHHHLLGLTGATVSQP